MPKSVHPAAPEPSSEPGYPTLRDEASTRGLSRRGFLLAALGGSAGAVTGCMGAPRRPAYPRRPWRTISFPLNPPVALPACPPERGRGASPRPPAEQGYLNITVASRHDDFVRRLRPADARRALGDRLRTRLSQAVCQHDTPQAFQARIRRALQAEAQAWYHQQAGRPVSSRSLRVALRVGPLPPRRPAIATD